MIALDVVVILACFSLLIVLGYGLFKLFARADDIITRANNTSRVLYVTTAIVLSVLLCTTFTWLGIYFSERLISVIPTEKTIGTILDIAFGYTFMIFAIILLITTPFLISLVLEYLKEGKTIASAWLIGIMIIIDIGILMYIMYNVYISTNSLSDLFNGCTEQRFWKHYEFVLFGKSAPYFEVLPLPDSWSWLKKDTCDMLVVPFSSIDLNDYPIKISQAYIHFSDVFRSWGLNSTLANITSVMLPITSLLADILGIAGYIESKRRKKEDIEKTKLIVSNKSDEKDIERTKLIVSSKGDEKDIDITRNK